MIHRDTTFTQSEGHEETGLPMDVPDTLPLTDDVTRNEETGSTEGYLITHDAA